MELQKAYVTGGLILASVIVSANCFALSQSDRDAIKAANAEVSGLASSVVGACGLKAFQVEAKADDFNMKDPVNKETFSEPCSAAVKAFASTCKSDSEFKSKLQGNHVDHFTCAYSEKNEKVSAGGTGVHLVFKKGSDISELISKKLKPYL